MSKKGNEQKFFNKITSIRKLKKETKKMLQKDFGFKKLSWACYVFKIKRKALYEWMEIRKNVNRYQSGKESNIG